jgi:hypothetical protein
MIQPEGFCSVEVKLLENGVIGNFASELAENPTFRARPTDC